MKRSQGHAARGWQVGKDFLMVGSGPVGLVTQFPTLETPSLFLHSRWLFWLGGYGGFSQAGVLNMGSTNRN